MKINIILLASGFSRRFNGNKLLKELNNKPLYMYIVDTLSHLVYGEKSVSSYIDKIICVTQYDEIEENLKNTNIHVIRNNNSDLGVSSSIKLGIDYDLKANGYMFIVCDQPFIKKETLEKIVKTFEKNKKGIIALGMKKSLKRQDTLNIENIKENIMDESDVIGNPVVFSRNYISELLSLKGDVGGKKILKKHIDDVEVVYTDDELELMDVDTIDSYENIQTVLEVDKAARN